jgi:recombination protein RecA
MWKKVGHTARSVGKIERSIRSTRKRARKKIVETLHSGCSVLNLPISGDVRGGWPRGRVINIVGDGSSGKTVLALDFAAWCYYNVRDVISKIYPKVKEVKIIYYNAEGVMDFDLAEMYGEEFVNNIDWRPLQRKKKKKGQKKRVVRQSLEAWSRDIGRELNAHKSGTFVLYILDSLDALVPEASAVRFDKQAETDEQISHQLGEKAAFLSQEFFGNLVERVSGKDFTLMIISQTRKKIGVMFGDSNYRTGGKGLDFYTHIVPWLSVVEKPKKNIDGEKVEYAIKTRVKVKRSKVCKPFRQATFTILWDYGLDEYRSLIDYVWKGVGEVKFAGKKWQREDLVKKLEKSTKLHNTLLDMAQAKWDRKEEAVKPERVPKYR